MASIILIAGTLILGPMLYLLYVILQSVGVFLNDFISMSFFTEPDIAFGGSVLGFSDAVWLHDALRRQDPLPIIE